MLAGPLKELDLLFTLTKECDIEGVLSPLSPVSLSERERAAAGIDPRAAYYAFAYPYETLARCVEATMNSGSWMAPMTPWPSVCC